MDYVERLMKVVQSVIITYDPKNYSSDNEMESIQVYPSCEEEVNQLEKVCRSENLSTTSDYDGDQGWSVSIW